MTAHIGIDGLLEMQATPPRLTRIYTLSDPRDGAVRYVGKTSQTLKARLRVHISASQRVGTKTYVGSWIRGLASAGHSPDIIQIDTTTGNWATLEREWIALYREQGAKLTNLTDGGEGGLGYVRSQQEKDRISATLKARFDSDPELRAKVSAGLFKRWADNTEARARAAAITSARYEDPAARAATSVKSIAYYKDPAARARAAEYSRAYFADPAARVSAGEIVRQFYIANPEARAKVGDAAAERWADPDYAAKVCISQKARWAVDGAKDAASERMLGQWSDPVSRAKRVNSIRSAGDKISASQIARFSTPEGRAKHAAAINAGHARRRMNKAKAAQEASLERSDDLAGATPDHD